MTTRAERAAVLKDAVTYLTRSRPNPPPVAGPPPATYGTSVPGGVGGTVPATLSLTLGPAASFGPFTPGLAKTYFASTTANVISTAGDALLSVSDPSSVGTGHLVNGTFVLPEPLQARARNAANTGTAYNNVGQHRPEPADLERAGVQRRRDARVQPARQGQRPAAHGHLQQGAHLHVEHHPAVGIA